MMARGSRVAWSILERLGRFDGGSNPPYPIQAEKKSLRAIVLQSYEQYLPERIFFYEK